MTGGHSTQGVILPSDTVKKAERNFEIAARTLCLLVRRYAALYSSVKNPRFPGNISVLDFF